MTASTNNISIDGARDLRITPQGDAAGNGTSGRIETKGADFQPAPGGKLRIEARLQMPGVTGAAARGNWPAFRALGSPCRGNWWNWPGTGGCQSRQTLTADIIAVTGTHNVYPTFTSGRPADFVNVNWFDFGR
jgi:hypothetical protein